MENVCNIIGLQIKQHLVQDVYIKMCIYERV